MPGPSKKLIEEGFYTYKKKASKGLCWVRGCRERSKKDRCLCSKHQMRRWRSQNNKTGDYCKLMESARRRNLDFDITPDYWRGLTDAFNYYTLKNPDMVLTIDRVDPTKGYVMGNLRVVTLEVNSRKGARERYLPEHVQAILERNRSKVQDANSRYLELGEEDYYIQGGKLNLLYPEVIDEDNCPF